MKSTHKLFTTLLSLFVIFITNASFAAPNFLQTNKQLPASEAFKLQIHFQNKSTLIARWQLAPGYMLYKKRIHIKTTNDSPSQIGKVTLIPNDTIKKITINNEAVYEHSANVLIFIKKPANLLQMIIRYQGCKGSDFCYPPQAKLINANLQTQQITITNAPKATVQAISRVDKIKEILLCKNTFITIISFFVFGLLLAFTPCVLPMLPILFGIIIGQKEHFHHKHTFLLTSIYILSIAITFTILGIIAGLLGNTIQALAQNAWVIGAFSFIFVFLALSLFGLYEIQLPVFIRNRFFNINQKQTPGSYAGAIIMGCLSTIIISPCVTPPLIGALVYIGATGNITLGGTALFFLGLGMGVPFLIIAMLGSHVLPKMGEWANTIKPLFGFLMLGMAIWLLDRILPSAWILLLSGILLILLALVIYIFTKAKFIWKQLVRLISIIILIYGVILIIGAGLKQQSIFYPFNGNQKQGSALRFKLVKNETQLQKQLALARMKNMPVILDFYARWCAACEELDKTTFTNQQLKQATSTFLLLRVDITENRDAERQLAKRFHIYAPPSIIFFDPHGNELKNLQVYGYIKATSLAQIIQKVIEKQQNNELAIDQTPQT